MPSLAVILFAVSASVANSTIWMRPEAFHISIGMEKDAAERAINDSGYIARPGDHSGQLIVDCTPTRSLTMEFEKDRLRSIRFELYLRHADLDAAFEEEKKFLFDALGKPKSVKSKVLLIYDKTDPNVMVVAQRNEKSMSALLVRYHERLNH